MKAAGSAVCCVLLVTLSTKASPQAPYLEELRTMVPTGDSTIHGVELVDVEGDGDVDALLAIGLGPQISSQLLLNDGFGVFERDPDFPTDADISSDVEVADLDGDGELDVYLSTYGGQDRLRLGDGAGNFVDGSSVLPSEVEYDWDAVIGDVDGDGDPDLFSATKLGKFGRQSRLVLGDGAGAFTDATSQLPAIFDAVNRVHLFDVDLDGDLDALVLIDDQGAGDSRIDLNDGTGVFRTSGVPLPNFLDSSEEADVADVDLDGDIDVVTAETPGRLFLGDGTGGFAAGQVLTSLSPSFSTGVVVIADVDTDGDLDALITRGTTLHTIQDLASAPEVSSSSSSSYVSTIDLGDVDGDGDPDLMTGYNFSAPGLVLNDGSGAFTLASSPLPTEFSGGQAGDLGDVDGDGYPDLVTASTAWENLWRNTGDGLFEYVPDAFPIVYDYTVSLALFDSDGDGDLDAYAGNRHFQNGNLGDQARLYRNDGTGLFADSPGDLPVADDLVWDVTPGDLDADGDNDFVLGLELGLLLGRNDGAGVFIHDPGALQHPGLFNTVVSVELGDLDGDGDLDVVTGCEGCQNRVYTNDGSGVFTEHAAGLPAVTDVTNVVVLEDVDDDGDLDVFYGNNTSLEDRLFLNDGAAQLTLAPGNLPGTTANTGGAVFLDLDDDGDRDLATSTQTLLTGGINRVFLNDGAGVFTDVTPAESMLLVQCNDMLGGDLDGDGDEDVLVVDSGEVRLLTNMVRQLSRRSVPRLGKQLALDMAGTPGGPWILSVASGVAEIPIAPFGILRLDPFTLNVLGGAVLDAEGRAALELVLPSDPSFAGATLHWQVALGIPLRFSNREATTLTEL